MLGRLHLPGPAYLLNPYDHSLAFTNGFGRDSLSLNDSPGFDLARPHP
ncbi:hypothetical protein [Streptomyces sp. NPDC054863]